MPNLSHYSKPSALRTFPLVIVNNLTVWTKIFIHRLPPLHTQKNRLPVQHSASLSRSFRILVPPMYRPFPRPLEEMVHFRMHRFVYPVIDRKLSAYRFLFVAWGFVHTESLSLRAYARSFIFPSKTYLLYLSQTSFGHGSEIEPSWMYRVSPPCSRYPHTFPFPTVPMCSHLLQSKVRSPYRYAQITLSKTQQN